MRRLEARMLDWEDVDLRENIIHVGQAGAKFGKRREVPIHPFLREVLLQSAVNPLHGPASPLDEVLPLGHGRKGAVLWTRDRKRHYAGGKSFDKLREAIAPDFGFHHFRKTCATSLRRNGVDPGVIDSMLGWAARTVQDKYYVAMMTADLHRAILKLYVDDPLGI
jgi:integrase